jgi:glutamyl-tRNA reductase
MRELLAVGASHRTATLALRERLALGEDEAAPFLRALVARPEIAEAVVLSTCNRTELYAVSSDAPAAEATVRAALERRARTSALALHGERNCDAARHLFRVVGGLDSMVVGETEIQGQVKRAYELAVAAGTAGPLTHGLFQAALATGKRVRAETAIAAGPASVGGAAVAAARRVLGPLERRRVLVVGAGETARLLARVLRAQGVGDMTILNRDPARAEALAREAGAGSGSLAELPRELEHADVVVCATAAADAIVGAASVSAAMAARAARPLLILDLAVPRDVDPACARLDGVTVLDLDGLQAAIHGTLTLRRGEAARAEAIVEREIRSFAGWLGTLEAAPVLAALHARGEAVVSALLAENAGRWESLSERDHSCVETLARAVVRRLLDEPTRRVKALDRDARHARLQSLCELFGLEPGVAPGEDAVADVRPLRGSAA